MKASHIIILLGISLLSFVSSAHSIPQSTHPKKLKVPLIPHKAIYDLTLTKVDNGSQLLNLEGEMVFTLQSSCEGWITDQLFNMFYEYQDTPHIKITSTISTYESYDGTDFQFLNTRQRNDELIEEIQGYLETEQHLKQAHYQKPESKTLPISPDTFLPIQHTYEVLRAATQGKKFITLPLFDGGNDVGIMDVSAFISPATTSKHHIRQQDPLYKIDLAFFQQTSKTEQAEYEITLYIHKSGIISYMLVNYGDFTVAQTLRSSETLQITDCATL